MTTRVSKSYQYNGICDICGFAYKNYQLRRRWDGYWVCKDDWEQRHPLDFYRTINDVHVLPFTRPDTQEEKTWVPTTSGVAPSVNVTSSFIYKIDAVNSKINFAIEYIIGGIGGDQVGFINGCNISLPVTAVSAGSFTWRRSDTMRDVRATTQTYAIPPTSTQILFGTGSVVIANNSAPYTPLAVTIYGQYGI